jgi:hypothetical protein
MQQQGEHTTILKHNEANQNTAEQRKTKQQTT